MLREYHVFAVYPSSTHMQVHAHVCYNFFESGYLVSGLLTKNGMQSCFNALNKNTTGVLEMGLLMSTLPHTATHCNTLQHTATRCNTLQHTATHCNTLQIGDLDMVLLALESMERNGVQLNRIHWTIAIKASCRYGTHLTLLHFTIFTGTCALSIMYIS